MPALGSASMEDDDALQDKWAALLANAADPRADTMPPSFPQILSELTPGQAQFLDAIYERLLVLTTEAPARGPIAFTPLGDRGSLLSIYITTQQLSPEQFRVDIDTLVKLRLIEVDMPPILDWSASLNHAPMEREEVYRMTSLGSRFVRACRPPAHVD
jgi:hypothetical protein